MLLNKNRLSIEVFSEAFKESLDNRGIRGRKLAEWTGRTENNISRMRAGKDSPSMRDFAEILLAIEEHHLGFFEDYVRQLIGQARRATISPEEFVNSLDSSEFAALMIAAGVRLSQVEPFRLVG